MITGKQQTHILMSVSEEVKGMDIFMNEKKEYIVPKLELRVYEQDIVTVSYIKDPNELEEEIF